MTKPNVTKERLEKIASWSDVYGESANVMIPALEAKQIAEALLAVVGVQSIATEAITEIMSYTLPAGFCDVELTSIDLSALQKMPESEWFSWRDDRLKGVNRPHYRCFRLLKAGLLESRVTNPEAPYQSVEFRKIEAQTTPAAPDEIDRFVDQVCGDKPADHQQ